jgi:acetyl esterase/lipase
VTIVNDTTYATALDASGREWMLDVYAPTDGGAGPVVVFAHGAGGNRKGYANLGAAMAERGAVVFMVDWPVVHEDIAVRDDGAGARKMTESLVCAVRFASVHAAEYGGDPHRMVVGAHSFAGSISAWVALVGEDADALWEDFSAARGGPPQQVQCAEGGEMSRVQGLLSVGGTYGIWTLDRYWETDRELMELVDVYPHVGKNPKLTARLILGDRDAEMTPHVETFRSALAEAGYDVKLLTWDGDHGIPVDLTAEVAVDLAR